MMGHVVVSNRHSLALRSRGNRRHDRVRDLGVEPLPVAIVLSAGNDAVAVGNTVDNEHPVEVVELVLQGETASVRELDQRGRREIEMAH